MQAKHAIVGALLAIAAFSLTASFEGQATSSSESINICGYDFHLGMAQVSSLEKAAAGSCKTIRIKSASKNDDSAFMLNSGTEPIINYGMLEFKHGRLVQISKEWEVSIRSPQQYSNILFTLFQRLQREGVQTCSVVSEEREEPDTSLKQTIFVCGSKKVKLTAFKYRNEDGFQVEEVLE